MKDSSHLSGREDENPGLPGLSTWRGVYCFVLGSFVFWVALLIVLTNAFS